MSTIQSICPVRSQPVNRQTTHGYGSFDKTTDSYEVCRLGHLTVRAVHSGNIWLVGSVCSVFFSSCFSFVTIKRQTPYESGILRQDYGITRGLPVNHTRFAEWGHPVCKYIYRNGPKRVSLITASDQTVRAVHSCNSWFKSFCRAVTRGKSL